MLVVLLQQKIVETKIKYQNVNVFKLKLDFTLQIEVLFLIDSWKVVIN